MKEQTIARTGVMRRAWALLLAAALCLGLMPSAAWAEEGEDGGTAPESAEASVVTLTVTAGSKTDIDTGAVTYPTWVNKQYALDEVLKTAQAAGGTGHAKADLTMEDLLDTAVAKGDLKGYDASPSSYGGQYLNAITSKDGTALAGWNSPDSSASLYWSLFDNGGYASTSFDQIKLVGGSAYQFCWASYSSAAAPSDWAAYYAKNPADQAKKDDGSTISEVATLTVTAGSKTDYDTGAVTYPTWVNKQYALDEVLKTAQAAGGTGHAKADLTMEDLLDTAVAKGDLKGYDASASQHGKYLNAIASKDGSKLAGLNSPDFSLSQFWSVFAEGVSASVSFDQVKIETGRSYQLCWDTFSSAVAPSDWSAYYVANPVTKAEAGGDPADPGDKVDPPADTNVAHGVNMSDMAFLMNNIASSYQGTTDVWQVMDLAAMGRLTKAEAQAFVPVALEGMKNPAPDSVATALQRNIIALSAAGADAAAVPDGDGTYHAVEAMAQKVTAASPVNVQAFTLLAYSSGDYAAPEDAKISEEALVRSLCANQLSDGGFSYGGSKADADMTAIAITALSPYASKDATVQNVVNKALNALKAIQLGDGGFGGSGIGVEAGTNTNSTAMAVIALCAAGIDPAASWATASGATPMSALLSQATEDLTAFVYAGKVNDFATEQGFRALVAYQGLKNTGAAYNIYTQAKLGQAALPAAEQEESDVESAGTPAADKKALAKTGDGSLPYAAGAAALALGALATGVAAARRMRASDELSARR